MRELLDSLRAIRRAIAAGRPPRGWAVAAAASLIAASAIGVLPPVFTGRIVDALQRHDVTRTLQDLAAFAAITLVTALLGLASAYATTSFRESVARNLRVLLMEKLLRAPLSELERLSFGEIANRLSEDLDELSIRFEYSLFPMLSSACQLVATLSVMIAIDPRFATISIAAVALSIVPARIVAPRFARLQRREAGNRDARAGTIGDKATLAGMTLMRHPQAARRHLQQYAALADEARTLRVGTAVLDGTASVASALVNLAGPVAVLGLGAYLLLHHGTTVGTIVMFLLYQGRLYAPFSSLANLPLQTISLGIYAKRVLEIAQLGEERSGSQRFVQGDLHYCNVSVRKGERAILDGASVAIAAGTHVGVVGPSGAGKSTLASLALRLSDASGGEIRIGPHALADFDLAELRESVIVVPQDPLLCDATLRDNLTYLSPEAGDAEIDEAIRACALDDVVARLPGGLQTALGQRAFRLSGGERQRVCVARAMLARPQLLVLDEALTGVDVETEARIMRAIRNVMTGRTLIVITHRLHCVVDFDRIVVVDDGRIVDTGTHEGLGASCAWYRDAAEAARVKGELLTV